MTTPVLGVVFGTACDGELRPDEVAARLDEIRRAGGDLGELPLPPAALDRLEAALAHVTTEASAMAVRCARGETGEVAIRNGRGGVSLTPAGGQLLCFDVEVALESAARLARAIVDARDLLHAQDILNELGVSTELQYEIEHGGQSAP
jgi:hypothetical protein